jgi:pilus assembly protein Flp/PilA
MEPYSGFPLIEFSSNLLTIQAIPATIGLSFIFNMEERMINHLALLLKHYLVRLGIAHEEGQGLVEYALIILLIALVVIGAVRVFGVQLNDTFTLIVDSFP